MEAVILVGIQAAGKSTFYRGGVMQFEALDRAMRISWRELHATRSARRISAGTISWWNGRTTVK